LLYQIGDFVFKQTQKNKITEDIIYSPYYQTKVLTDKIDNILIADGIDIMTITIEVYDYQNIFQDTWNGIITLDIEGVTKDLDVVNGIASTTFKTSVVDAYLVKTVKKNFGNTEIEVIAQ